MTTSPVRAVLLCAAAALLAPSCTGSTPPPPPPPPPVAAADTVVVFARPGAPYRAMPQTAQLATVSLVTCGSREREEAKRTIGPEGGTVPLPSGHSLTVPRGALRSSSEFSLAQAAHPAHLVLEVYGGEADQPFAVPVTLTFNAGGCDAPAPGKSRRVVRLRMSSPGTDVGGAAGAGGTFSVSLTVLSRYALAEG